MKLKRTILILLAAVVLISIFSYSFIHAETITVTEDILFSVNPTFEQEKSITISLKGQNPRNITVNMTEGTLKSQTLNGNKLTLITKGDQRENGEYQIVTNETFAQPGYNIWLNSARTIWYDQPPEQDFNAGSNGTMPTNPPGIKRIANANYSPPGYFKYNGMLFKLEELRDIDIKNVVFNDNFELSDYPEFTTFTPSYNNDGDQSGTNPGTWNISGKRKLTEEGEWQYAITYGKPIGDPPPDTTGIGRNYYYPMKVSWEAKLYLYYRAGTVTYTYDNEETPVNGPVAVIDAPYNVAVGQAFTVSGLNSYDPEGQPLTYTWNVKSGGVSLPSGAEHQGSFEWQVDTETTINIELTVENTDGLTDTSFAQINVLDSAPPEPASNPPIAEINIQEEVFWNQPITDVYLNAYDTDGHIVDEEISFSNGYDALRTDSEIETFKNGEFCFCDRQYVGLTRVEYEVEDNSGEDADDEDYINVLPTTPRAAAHITGRRIENRKITFDLRKSDEVTRSIHIFPIDYSKSTFEIVPADAYVTAEDIHIKKASDHEYLAQFDKPGKYAVHMTVTNTFDEQSDVTEYVIEIAEDTPPVVKYKVQDQSTRNPATKKAKIQIYDFSIDEEGDEIQFTGSYRYDANNNTFFDGETVVPITFDPESNNTIEVTGLGKRLFELGGKEYFTDYIPEFHKPEHFLSAVLSTDITVADRTNEVINIPPTYTFDLKREVEADMLVIGGKTTEEVKQRFRNSLNTIKSNLLANDMDFSYQEAGLQGKMAIFNKGSVPYNYSSPYAGYSQYPYYSDSSGYYEIIRTKDSPEEYYLSYIQNNTFKKMKLTNVYYPSAMAVQGNKVFVVDENRIHEFDLSNGTSQYTYLSVELYHVYISPDLKYIQ